MNLKIFLLMLSKVIEEYGLETKLIQKPNNFYLIFGKPQKRNYKNTYYLRLKNSEINIHAMKSETKLLNKRFQMVPERRVLLSVDLHNPYSLKIIREWLKTFDNQI